MTRPRPLAPPVTSPTLPSKLKEESVRLKWKLPRPCTGSCRGISLSAGYGMLICRPESVLTSRLFGVGAYRTLLSVREKAPTCEPCSVGSGFSSSDDLSSLHKRRELWKDRCVAMTAAGRAAVDVRGDGRAEEMARVACFTADDLNILRVC